MFFVIPGFAGMTKKIGVYNYILISSYLTIIPGIIRHSKIFMNYSINIIEIFIKI